MMRRGRQIGDISTIHLIVYGGQFAICCGTPLDELPSQSSSTTTFPALSNCPGPSEEEYVGKWARFGQEKHQVKEMSVVGQGRKGPSIHLVMKCGRRLTTIDFKSLLRADITPYCANCLLGGG